jgi:hypothetical protein
MTDPLVTARAATRAWLEQLSVERLRELIDPLGGNLAELPREALIANLIVLHETGALDVALASQH